MAMFFYLRNLKIHFVQYESVGNVKIRPIWNGDAQEEAPKDLRKVMAHLIRKKN